MSCSNRIYFTYLFYNSIQTNVRNKIWVVCFFLVNTIFFGSQYFGEMSY